MEEKGGVNSSSGVAVKGDEAPESYRVAPRSESNNIEFSGSIVSTTPVSSVTEETPKKKRGRPRKYGPDGKVASIALSPMPISASIPLAGDFSAWGNSGNRPIDSFNKKNKFEAETPGERMAYSVGANFTPHVITVNAGEDVNMKIISFSQEGSRAICVLAANGAISNVTLRQPNSSGGTLTYEGHFEILSLSGSYMPSDNGVTKSRSGGMSVSLSGPDGRVMGGGLAGMLIAAGPVQVVVGSFLPGHQLDQKAKKQRVEHAAFAAIPAPPISKEQTAGAYSGPSPNIAASISFPGDNLVSANSIYSSRISTSQNNVSLPGEESKEHNTAS
ncbi:AT-hook motif nuclear-localized protein 1 [Capsicum chinense]|uniref:AT-hook motif nuclear-localized protein n=1 Tax=Capsicum annuum TaxID=4072 RepID=A0A1U8G0U5_CAPAN|nr:AT-hook motif nuclear-localized protein 1 isoform X1 [Capsicum annuum]PHU22892.1 AT-hook motif nuclear-localized protein 1 [Capsicum chinense]KAF3615594.1 AT-hook motif nuclear-localized protein 1 [Capsicum annuum]KAF3618181.1 AT-hook motif nuclear-localized protein 1 [Capsicum annuum]PHT87118.1 AT-hook motif nuclear-localized protein 1 [Capsicum annuum]PHT87127.1 AT-hook motif nuclear-localized protein 1 [Capsicum annuum]